MTHVPGLQNKLGYWLRVVSQQDAMVLEKKLKAQDTLLGEWLALRLINDQDEVLSTQLSVQLSMTRGAVSKMLDRLEKKELITRKNSRSDLRLQPLSISKKGQKLLEELSRIADAHDEEFFGSISEVQKSVLFSVLHRLADLHEAKALAPVQAVGD